jgi:curved DNA-binding protein CbpA
VTLSARLYHPDRNQGKEVEYVPKFQSIQAAHEILSDPETRAKYDADRRKLGYGAGVNFRPTTGQTNFDRSPYATYSNWAPPPRRAPPRQTPAAAPTAQQSYASARAKNTGPFGGPRVPPNLPPRAKDDADARATAWQRMQGARAKQKEREAAQQAFSEDDFNRTGRAARDAANAHTAKPGLGRSNTARTTKKSGFDPNSTDEGGWEPQAKRTSAYSSYANTHHQAPPQPSTASPVQPFASQRSSPRAKPPAGFQNVFAASAAARSAEARSAEDTPFSEGNPRLSTPYNAHSGEKTYFDSDSLRRSASTHAAAKMGAQGDARHRSASPPGRGQKPHGERLSPSGAVRPNSSSHTHKTSNPRARPNPFAFPSSSESEEESPAPRQKAAPGKFWTSNETKAKGNGNETQTAPENLINGPSGSPPMYDKFLQSPHSFPYTANKGNIWKSWTQSWQSGPQKSRFPLWAIPSSVTPKTSSSLKQVWGKSSAVLTESPLDSKIIPVAFVSSCDDSIVLSRILLANSSELCRFTFAQGQQAPNKNHKSQSSDNISTSFTAQDWAGKFEGSKDFVAPPVRKGSKSRPSTRTPRMPSYQQPSFFGTQNNPIDLSNAPSNPIDLSHDGFRIPPPPPNPPINGQTFHVPQASATQATGTAPVQFSAEEWAKTLKDGKFFYPDSSRSTSPTKSNSTATRRTKVGRARTKSKSEGRPTQPPLVSVSDASDEGEGPIGKKNGVPLSATNVDDSDAMEIDTESPIVNNTAKGPRLVPVPPMRPEWRETASTGHIPTAVPNPGGQVPAGTIPTAVSNAAIPNFVPPPPKVKKTRGTSGGLNLGDLKNVTPLAPSSDGLHGMADLRGTLPFESHASAHPLKTFQPQQLELPAPPKAQVAIMTNGRLTETGWRNYVAHISWYMGQWYQFNDQMLKHFNTRHHNAAKFGTGVAETNATRLLTAIGEGSAEDGLESYITGLDEDVRVRRHWDVACEKHLEAVKGFATVKAKVKAEGLLQG